MVKVHFEDKGQDILWWVIDEGGVIVDAGPYQKEIWVNCVTEFPEDIYQYQHLPVFDGDSEKRFEYAVIEIESYDEPLN